MGEFELDASYYEKRTLSSPDFVNTVVHELGHMEQELTVAEYCFEKLGIRKNEPLSEAEERRFSDLFQLLQCNVDPAETELYFGPTYLKGLHSRWDGLPLSDAKTLAG